MDKSELAEAMYAIEAAGQRSLRALDEFLAALRDAAKDDEQ